MGWRKERPGSPGGDAGGLSLFFPGIYRGKHYQRVYIRRAHCIRDYFQQAVQPGGVRGGRAGF